jgi:transcriptional regulator with XRE-family HTH domain
MKSRCVSNLPAGQRVRHWRELKGISQLELAKKSKIDPSRLCKIELGQLRPRAEDIETLAGAMDMTMAEFYGATASNESVA